MKFVSNIGVILYNIFIVKILSNSGTTNQICTHNNLKQYYKFGENSLNYLKSF